MTAFFKKHKLLISGILFNIIAISLVIFTVVYAFMSFQNTSYKQNVDNLQTMTNSSSGKVSVVFNHYEEDMNRLVSFVCKQNNDEGMTYDELTSFFLSYYEDVVDVEFQVIDSVTQGGTGSNEYFGGVNLSGGEIT